MRNPFASPLWRNEAFVRVWSAATVSIFGSLLTRIALPLVAILTLGAGPIEVAALRAVELVSLAVVGLVAGAWVDRLRRRPFSSGRTSAGPCSWGPSRSPSPSAG